MDIIKALTREAHAAGICEDHFKQMLTEDTPALFDHFKTMIQECTFSGFPSVELIRACWDKKDLNAAGIFVQQTVDTEAVQGVDVFWLCEGTVRVKEWAVVHAYVAYGSNLKFEVAPNAILILDIFDDSPVRINNKSVRSVTVYQWGHRVPVLKGNIRIKRKKWKPQGECRLRYQVADGEVRDMQTMGFHLMESPDILAPEKRSYEEEDYPERDGVKIYPYTVDKAFEYTVKLLYFGELKTMNEAIRSLWDSFFDPTTNGDVKKALPVTIYNLYKGVKIVGYPTKMPGSETIVQVMEGAFYLRVDALCGRT